MKKIAPVVYEKLTPHQRTVAYIDAQSRRDEDESRRLFQSCPRFEYVQRDVEFTGAVDDLFGIAMAIEADLRECFIWFLISIRIKPKEAFFFLQRFSNIQHAWGLTLAALGIDKEKMALAGPPASSAFDLFDGGIPEPEAEESERLSAEMLKYLEQMSNQK